MPTKTAVKKPPVTRVRKPVASKVRRPKPVAEKLAESPVVSPSPAAVRNHFMILLDASYSMRPHAESAKKIMNQNINAIRGETIRSGQDATVTVGTFGSRVDLQLRAARLDDLRVFSDYHPDGNTAMLRAIDEAIDAVQIAVADTQNDSYLMIVVTDGEENASGVTLQQSVPERLRKLQGTDRWSVVFLVPSESYASELSIKWGVPRGNVSVWEQTAGGMERASASVTRGIAEYVAIRGRGLRATSRFFETNAADIKKRDLSKLEDLADETKWLQVKAECVIREFVQSEIGDYRIGSAFYELTKDETIQRYKAIAIMERGGRKVYGGDDARALLGLPDADCRVKIGNHGQYRIFVQSTSVNRKLVRGTSLLIIPRFATGASS